LLGAAGVGGKRTDLIELRDHHQQVMRLAVVLIEVVIGGEAQLDGVFGVVPFELGEGLLLGGEFLGTAGGEQDAQDEQVQAGIPHDSTMTRVWLGADTIPTVLGGVPLWAVWQVTRTAGMPPTITFALPLRNAIAPMILPLMMPPPTPP